MKQQQQQQHYVNNKEFLEHMIVFKEELKIAEEKELPIPRIPDEIGVIFMKIATHLSFKSNFINYGFREDMISDGIENCIQYIHNFDPEKSRNPFAYFTQIIHYAFLRRIQKEKKQLEIKTKIIEKTGFEEVMTVDDSAMAGSSSDYNTIKDNIQYKSSNR